jgi:predicted fused transcriptional regulator/phosphomethylpyrimidine kinase
MSDMNLTQSRTPPKVENDVVGVCGRCFVKIRSEPYCMLNPQTESTHSCVPVLAVVLVDCLNLLHS